jgi:hypothetical protein
MTIMAIDTQEGIEHYRMCLLIGGLRLEIKTGMKYVRGVSLIRVAQEYGCPKNTKKGALAWMESFYEATYGWAYGSQS